MTERLAEELGKIISASPCSKRVQVRFLERLEEGGLTREESNESHFCVYFLPFNPETNRVFFGDHIKAQMWISPGGHIEPEELPKETLVREFEEELGIKPSEDSIEGPFVLTITRIDPPFPGCREHLDIWYLVNTDGNGFVIDEREYHKTRWMSLEEAEVTVTEPNNLLALKALGEKLMIGA